MGSEKKCVQAFFFTNLAVSAVPVHAQTGSSAADFSSLQQLVLVEDSWLMIGLVAAVLVIGFGTVLIKRKAQRHQPHSEEKTYAGGYETVKPGPSPRTSTSVRPLVPVAGSDERTDTVIAPAHLPVDFDVPKFLQKTKAAFLHLQAAWDNGDLKEIRRLTSRELYAQFCKQLAQRGGTINVTRVESLSADLKSLETVGQYYIATVKFNGLSKDGDNGKALPFLEVWTLSKPLDNHRNWTVTGIEQY